MKLQVKLAARYLWGRKLRTVLTTLAIVFSTMMIFGMNTILPAMIESFQVNIMAASGQVDVTISAKTGEAFASRVMNQVKTVEGLRGVSGSLRRTINIPTNYYGRDSGATVTALTLTGIEPDDAQRLRSYPVKQGRFLRSSDTHKAVIAASLADSLGLVLGDEMNLPTPAGTVELEIIGLLPARALPGNEEVLVTLDEAQKWLDLPHRVNTIEANLNTTNEAERAAIESQIEAVLGDEYTLGTLSNSSELLASIQTGQIAMNLFGFAALGMGGFIIFNTFRTIVAERRHDIGMLRSIGASRRTILGLIMTEGLIQGLLGTGLGILCGYGMSYGLLSALGPMMQGFLHIEMGNPVVQPGLLAVTIVAGVGITLLAGFLPARSASRITPMEALRPTVSEAQEKSRRASLILGLILIAMSIVALFSKNLGLTALGGMLLLGGLVVMAPALVVPIARVFSLVLSTTLAREGTGTLAEGNMTRQPGRAAITASATMIGLAVIVAMGGMVHSMTGNFLGVLERSLGSDYLLMPPAVGVWGNDVGAKETLADDIREISGVDLVSTLRFAASSAEGQAVSMLGIDPVVFPQVSSLTFQEGHPDQAYPAMSMGRAIIVNGVFAAQAGYGPGDMVRLSTPTGPQEYMVVAIAYDYMNAKLMTAYVSQENLAHDFRKTEDVFLQVNVTDNADRNLVETRMEELLADYEQFKLVSGQAYFEESKQLFDAVFGFYWVILSVLAVPSLISMLNTLAIGVIERTREIGMLRAIGATRKQVKRTVVAESLLLAAMGTVFGLITGLYLGYVLVMGLGVAGFPVDYVFPYVGLFAGLAIGLIFGVIAAMVPAKQAAGMNIVRALRYE